MNIIYNLVSDCLTLYCFSFLFDFIKQLKLFLFEGLLSDLFFLPHEPPTLKSVASVIFTWSTGFLVFLASFMYVSFLPKIKLYFSTSAGQDSFPMLCVSQFYICLSVCLYICKQIETILSTWAFSSYAYSLESGYSSSYFLIFLKFYLQGFVSPKFLSHIFGLHKAIQGMH